MDGRRIRWWLYGGLVLSAVGCTRNTNPDTPGLLKPGQPPGALPATGGGLFGRKPPAPPSALPTPGMSSVEVATGTPVKKSAEKGYLADTAAAFADTWAGAAFVEPPPPNRDELIDRARFAYQKALQKDPKNKGALIGLARLYAGMNDRERATEGYKKYLQVFPKDGTVCHEIAMTHARWKDWAGAASWCEVALRVDPENRSYRKTMGFSLARAGKWDEALASLGQIMPEAQARYHLAEVLDDMKYLDASRQQLQLALQADPNYAPAREVLAGLDQPAQPGASIPGRDPNPVQQAGYAPQP
ncbi:MAG: Tetratricopeptide repeat protein [Gemmataceae bacterium]|nr:Tetratricopeptide repeat protein [Gemmataceae bacterium]